MLTKLQDQLEYMEKYADTDKITFRDRQLIAMSLSEGKVSDVKTVWYVLDMSISDEVRGEIIGAMFDLKDHAQEIDSTEWNLWLGQHEFLLKQFESLCENHVSGISQIPGLIPVIPSGASYQSEKYLHANEYAAKHGVKLEDILLMD